jgi:glutamine amidotransferase
MDSQNKDKKVVILDYGMGNLFSVNQVCQSIGLETIITDDKKIIMEADALILPGVGAFGDAMSNLEKHDLVSPIIDFVQSGKPFMGVCLGMQLLFSESEEFGHHKGLDLIKGKIAKFPNISPDNKKIKVPQIAWNQINQPANRTWTDTPFEGLKNGEYMYFVHSYYAIPENEKDILSVTDYEGITYCSSILNNNIFAVQFHPEKSAAYGKTMYSNWAKSIK